MRHPPEERLRKRHEICLQQQPRIRLKVVLAHDEQQCVLANTYAHLVNRYGSIIDNVHAQARLHTQRSKGVVEQGKWYQPTGEALPIIAQEVTSELLHCLTAFPDPWPVAKITIDPEKPGQWVTKMARLYFAEECARRTDRIPNNSRGPAVEAALDEIEQILPKLEARMIEFLAEWLVS